MAPTVFIQRVARMQSSASGIPVRKWDAFDAYLFDIDGTLLHCRDAVHYFAFCEVLTSVVGRPITLEGIVAHGNTDPGILRDALLHAGIAEEIWRPRLPELLEGVRQRVRQRSTEMCVEVLPGVREVIGRLLQAGALLGVATGNLQAIGRLKLEFAGLGHHFGVGGWSDDCECRHEVFAAALREVRDLLGKQASVCLIGDTPADVVAAKRNGMAVVAVATGIYSEDELRKERPNLCLRSLEQLIGSDQVVPE